MSSSAERMRVLRARRQRGRMIVPVEIDDVEVVEALVQAGFLPPDRRDERAALADALERLIEAVVQLRP